MTSGAVVRPTWPPAAKSTSFTSQTRICGKSADASPGSSCGMIMNCLTLMPASKCRGRTHNANRMHTPHFSHICLSSLSSPSALTPPRVRLYRQLAFGDLLEVFALDERQYRSSVVWMRDLFITGCLGT
jgi:hypothetical protein